MPSGPSHPASPGDSPPRVGPRINAIVETCLYVAELARSIEFYRRVLGLRLLFSDDRMASISVADRHLLLLFRKGGTPQPVRTPGGVIPAGHGDCPVHLGLAIAQADFDAWERRLGEFGVAIESRVNWGRGGRSLYFRDPDQNLVELLTPGVWEIY